MCDTCVCIANMNGSESEREVVKAIATSDAFEVLHNELKKELTFNLSWIKGHSDNYYNNLADTLSAKYWDVCNEIECPDAEMVDNPCRIYVIEDTHNFCGIGK